MCASTLKYPTEILSCVIRYAGNSFTNIVHTLPRALLSRSSRSAVSRRVTFKRDLEVNSSQSRPVRHQTMSPRKKITDVNARRQQPYVRLLGLLSVHALHAGRITLSSSELTDAASSCGARGRRR